MRESNFHKMASRSTVVEKHVKTLFQREIFLHSSNAFHTLFARHNSRVKIFM